MDSPNWIACYPHDDVENFTERSDARRRLLEEINRQHPNASLSPLVWACFQVADLDILATTVRGLAWDMWSRSPGERSLPVGERGLKDTIAMWRQKVRGNTSSRASSSEASFLAPRMPIDDRHPAPQMSPPVQSSRTRAGQVCRGQESSVVRSARVKDQCKIRDNGLCIVSLLPTVDVCHIYPWSAFSARHQDKVQKFWKTLGSFWSEEKVAAWRNQIFIDHTSGTMQGTETLRNVISMTSTLHRYHTDCDFALRPVRIRADNTQLELEFHWLSRQKRAPSSSVNIMDEPMSSRRDQTSHVGAKRFSRYEPGRRGEELHSGARFMISTDDPIERPLPDPGLLLMQWHLQRICAMSGAAEWEEEDFRTDDLDDDDAQALSAVTQWLDDQSEGDLEYETSPIESVEIMDGAFE